MAVDKVAAKEARKNRQVFCIHLYLYIQSTFLKAFISKIMASTNSHNNETLKISEITEPPIQDPLVTQIGNCFERFADALGQHMTTLGNQISKNVIDAMNTSDNP